MPNVLAPAPLSSMRWNDAPTTSVFEPIQPISKRAAAAPPADQPRRRPRKCSSPRQNQVAPAAADAATAKPTASLQKLLLVMAAALALAGLTVSAIVRIGRMRARRAMRRKRRAMWDSAKTAKTGGVRRSRCSTTRTPGCGAPVACTIRRACPRSDRARASPRSGRAHPRSGDTRAPEDTAPERTRAQHRASGPGAAGYGNAGPARPQRADLTETEAAAISPAGAAACERTRSGRCGARA